MKHLIVATLVLEAFLISAAPAFAQQPPPPPPPPPPAETTPPPAPTPQPTYTPPPPAQPAESQYAGTGHIRDNTPKQRPMALSILGWLPWTRGFGFGVIGRFEIPIVHNGFISSINNYVSLEPSFGWSITTWDYGPYDADYMNFTPALYGTWSFHFSHEFRVYGGVGLGYSIGTETGDYDYDVYDNNYFYFDGMVGLFYNVASALSLRAELGSGGPKAGIALLF